MSKKSYKQQQNRLYREIKKRIIAEKALDYERHAKPRFPLNASLKSIERVGTRRCIQPHHFALYAGDMNGYMEMLRLEMAREIGEFLAKNGYIDYMIGGEEGEPDGYMPDGIEVKANLEVVRPWP